MINRSSGDFSQRPEEETLEDPTDFNTRAVCCAFPAAPTAALRGPDVANCGSKNEYLDRDGPFSFAEDHNLTLEADLR